MVKYITQHVVQIEFDTETGKQRVIKQYATPIGKGSWEKKKPKPPKPPKKPPQQLLGAEVEEEYVE